MRHERLTTADSGVARQRWALLPAVALVVLAWAILSLPWLTGRVAIPWDSKAQFLPQAQFLAQSLARGESPFWAPFEFSGHPQIADPQSLIFSPPYLALAFFDSSPGSWAVDVTLLTTILAGAIAMIVLFYDRGWHWAGGVLAALAFAFGASMAWRIQHTGQVLSLSYLPIVFVLLDRALTRSSWRYGAAAGAVAAFLVLGRDQVALLAVYLLAAYVIHYWLAGEYGSTHDAGPRVRRSLPPLVAGGVTGLALVALPVLMTMAMAAESNRPEIDFVGAGRGSLHPALLVTALAPDVFGSSGEMVNYWGPPSYTWRGTDLFIAQNMGQLYIGAVPVLLLIAGLVTGTLWRREIRFFTVALAAALIYAVGWYTPVFRLLHDHALGVDFYRRPADATFLIGFLAALLAGYTAHRLFADPLWQPSRLSWLTTAGIVVAGFLFALGAALYFDKLGPATRPLSIAAIIVAGGAAAIYAARRMEPLRPLAAGLLVIGYTVADLAYSNGPGGATALPPQEYEMLEPDSRNETIRTLKRLVAEGHSDTRRDRVELIGLGFHTPNASLTHGLENTLGYNPLRLDVYVRAVGAGDTSGGAADRKFTPLFPSYDSALADRLGLRFVASGVPIEQIDQHCAPGSLRLVARTADAFIYENPAALPRVRYVTRVVKGDFKKMIATGEGLIDDPSLVVLEHPPSHTLTSRGGRSRIISYKNTEVVLGAEGGGGYVVLADLWHPWWRVEIDGKPAEMLRADVLFRAVEVPPGTHEVRFTFHPIAGAFRSLAGYADATSSLQ